VHDVADGGLGATLGDLVVASGVGATVDGVADHDALFTEAPSRVVACVDDEGLAETRRRADEAGVPCTVLGRAGGERLRIGTLVDLSVAALTTAARERIPAALAAGATH
jgi:phosphoribosylformylglycinamidine synthase